MSAVAAILLTADEFMCLPNPTNGSQQELVQGEVTTMPPPKARHGIICSQINWLLRSFVAPRRLGWVTSNDTGFILERNPDTVRGPAVAYWSIVRQPQLPEHYFDIPPDLLVEVQSPDDRRRDVREKVRTYVAAGVPLAWLVDPDTRTVTVYAGSLRGLELDETDTLDGGTILPGFNTLVAAIFD